jgi:hypothetical protein
MPSSCQKFWGCVRQNTCLRRKIAATGTIGWILEQRISDLERDHPVGEKGFTKAGVRKMIARINEELAVFESREEARLATPR